MPGQTKLPFGLGLRGFEALCDPFWKLICWQDQRTRVRVMARPLPDNQSARRLSPKQHLLLRAGSGPGRSDNLDDVLDDLEFVQVNGVNTRARAHDLILCDNRGTESRARTGQAIDRR